MKQIVAASVALTAVLFAGSQASAEITVDAARAILVPFYKALNAEFAKDAPELIRQSTTPDWVTCRATRPATAEMRSWPGLDSVSERFRT